MDRRKFKKGLKRLKYLPSGKYFFYYVFNKSKSVYLKISHSHKVAFPSTIMLELTNHCNLACTTCAREYDYGKNMDKGNMNLSESKKIIDDLWPYLDSIGLTGLGETFIYKEIEQIVDYIKSKNKGIIISVSTNAVLPDFINKVKPLIGKIDTIQISIDGLHDVYEKIRLKSDFNVLEDNIKKLVLMSKNSDTDLIFNMVVTKENYMHMAPLVEYASHVGINYLDFTLFNLASVSNIDRSYYQFYKSREFKDAVYDLEVKLKKHKEVNVIQKNFKTDNGFKKCPYPWSHFYVSWDGYLVPCCAKPFPKELHFGQVFKEGFMNSVNSTNMMSFRNLWYQNITPDFCQKCHFINIEPIRN